MNKHLLLAGIFTLAACSSGNTEGGAVGPTAPGSTPRGMSWSSRQNADAPGTTVIQQAQQLVANGQSENALRLFSGESREMASRYSDLVRRLEASNLPVDVIDTYLRAIASPTVVLREEVVGTSRKVHLRYADGVEGAVWLVQEGQDWRLDLARELAPTLKQLEYGDWRLTTLTQVKEGKLPKSTLAGWGSEEWEEGEGDGDQDADEGR